MAPASWESENGRALLAQIQAHTALQRASSAIVVDKALADSAELLAAASKHAARSQARMTFWTALLLLAGAVQAYAALVQVGILP